MTRSKILSNVSEVILAANAMKVSFLHRSEIPSQHWNVFIEASPQRIVYAYTWYLDVVASDWGALVCQTHDQWQAVMPIPLKKKWRNTTVQQPLFCQLLGVFCVQNAPIEAEQALLTYLTQHFRYVSIYTGRFRTLPHAFPVAIEVTPCCTHFLDLRVDYQQLCEHYLPDRRRNLRLAEAEGWTWQESNDLQPLLQLFRQHHAAQIEGGVGEWAYQILAKLYQTLRQKEMLTLCYALKDGQFEAGAMFVISDGRIIYFFNAASDRGRKGNARTWLIDRMLQQYAGQDYVFDFESPMVNSIARFYESFGAKEEEYLRLRMNQLPFPLKQIQDFRAKKYPLFVKRKGTK
jgi:hypothetical protein